MKREKRRMFGMRKKSLLFVLSLTLVFVIPFTAFGAISKELVDYSFQNLDITQIKYSEGGYYHTSGNFLNGTYWYTNNTALRENLLSSNSEGLTVKNSASVVAAKEGEYTQMYMQKRYHLDVQPGSTVYEGTETIIFETEFKLHQPVAGADNYVALGIAPSQTATGGKDYTKNNIFTVYTSNGSLTAGFFNNGHGASTAAIKNVSIMDYLNYNTWYKLTATIEFEGEYSTTYEGTIIIKDASTGDVKFSQKKSTDIACTSTKRSDSLWLFTGTKSATSAEDCDIITYKNVKVSYTKPEIKPTATYTPADGSRRVPLNQTFHVDFGTVIEPVTADQLVISSPDVSITDFSMNPNNTGFSFSCSGLAERTQYTIHIFNIYLKDGETPFDYLYTFSTDYSVNFKSYYIDAEQSAEYDFTGGFAALNAKAKGNGVRTIEYLSYSDWVYDNSQTADFINRNDQNYLTFQGGNYTTSTTSTTWSNRWLYKRFQRKPIAGTDTIVLEMEFMMHGNIPEGVSDAFYMGLYGTEGLQYSYDEEGKPVIDDSNFDAREDRVFLFGRFVENGVSTVKAFGNSNFQYTGNYKTEITGLENNKWYRLVLTITPENPNGNNMIFTAKFYDMNNTLVAEASTTSDQRLSLDTFKKIDGIILGAGRKAGTIPDAPYDLISLKKVKVSIEKPEQTFPTLSEGKNTICIDYENATPENPFEAMLIAVVCNGTPEMYTIERIVTAPYEHVEAATGTLKVDVEITDMENQFVKTFVFDNLYNIRPLTVSGTLLPDSN